MAVAVARATIRAAGCIMAAISLTELASPTRCTPRQPSRTDLWFCRLAAPRCQISVWNRQRRLFAARREVWEDGTSKALWHRLSLDNTTVGVTPKVDQVVLHQQKQYESIRCSLATGYGLTMTISCLTVAHRQSSMTSRGNIQRDSS